MLKVLCIERFRKQTDSHESLLVFLVGMLSRVENLHAFLAWVETYIHVRIIVRREQVNVFVSRI